MEGPLRIAAGIFWIQYDQFCPSLLLRFSPRSFASSSRTWCIELGFFSWILGCTVVQFVQLVSVKDPADSSHAESFTCVMSWPTSGSLWALWALNCSVVKWTKLWCCRTETSARCVGFIVGYGMKRYEEAMMVPLRRSSAPGQPSSHRALLPQTRNALANNCQLTCLISLLKGN